MSIDLRRETLLSFAEACEFLPGRPHLSTLHRWRQRGVKGVRLETCLVGGKRFTSIEALERFAELITTADSGCHPAQVTPMYREQQVQQAVTELQAELK